MLSFPPNPGASAGLGQGAAIEFAREGATLALTGRNQERLSETATKCTAVGLSEDKVQRKQRLLLKHI